MTRFASLLILLLSLSIISAGCNCCAVDRDESTGTQNTTEPKRPQQDDPIDLDSVYDLSDRTLFLEGGSMRVPE